MSEPFSTDPISDPADSPVIPGAAAGAPAQPSGHQVLLAWGRANPGPAAALGALLLTLAIFYGFVPLFYVPAQHSFITLLRWIRNAWTPETHYEHGPLVPAIILFLVWNDLPRLRGLKPVPTAAGLIPLVLGVGCYLLSARSLQPRFAWAGLPLLLWGGVLYAAGWRWLRTLFFPILCIFFLIPVPGIDQATTQLQAAATQAANVVCNAIGIKMKAVGTTLIAADDTFQFKVIGDCSGINSLMAITLMTAVFAYLTQNRLWKMLVLFSASVPVAIVGNVARLTSIMLVAKCLGQKAAEGFHEISAYVVSFPFAFGTLCLVNKLLNWNAKPSKPGGSASAADDGSSGHAAGRQTMVPAGSPGIGKTPTYDY